MSSVYVASEIKESSGVTSMSPVGWLAICCRRFSDWSNWLVQSWNTSSTHNPSPPYSGGKTGGEKKSLRVSWKSAPCRWIYSRERVSVILLVSLQVFFAETVWKKRNCIFALWHAVCAITRMLTLCLIFSDRKGRNMAKTGRKNIGSLTKWIPLTFSGKES